MIKKLCMSCSIELRKASSMEYLGKKNHMGTCEHCGRKTYITEYNLPTPSSLPAEKSRPAEQRTTITVDIDARTAVNIQRLADRWGRSCGEVIDSAIIHFMRNRKGGPNE
ncbi:MAG: hypothetical protein Q4P20_10290 [Eubacteriales bacterium]|nr:hypothetical protein [Eubacteriales bacterium]